jgi:hypothetical protein
VLDPLGEVNKLPNHFKPKEMPIYREILTFQNLEELYYLFEVIDASKLPDKVRQIAAYLQDGYQYTCIAKDARIKKMDLIRHTELIDVLHKCADGMIKPYQTRFMAVHLDDGTVINLEAFFNFLDELDCINECIDDLEELERVLQNYLNESNIWQYRECSGTVREILSLMKRIAFFMKGSNRLG